MEKFIQLLGVFCVLKLRAHSLRMDWVNISKLP